MGMQFPHTLDIGMEMIAIDPEAGRAEVKVPWRADLIGNPTTGTFAGGIITTALDSALGMSVMAALGQPMPFATLDLRIDYLRMPTAAVPIVCVGTCIKLTRKVAFTRGVAHDGSADDPVALAQGTFMMTHGAEAEPRTPGRAEETDTAPGASFSDGPHGAGA